MRRGEVWWALLPEPAGRRPVVLLSRDAATVARSQVTVALVTTRIRGIPSEVPLNESDGLDRSCVVNLDNLFTIDKSRLQARIVALSPEKLRAIEVAIHYALALSQ